VLENIAQVEKLKLTLASGMDSQFSAEDQQNVNGRNMEDILKEEIAVLSLTDVTEVFVTESIEDVLGEEKLLLQEECQNVHGDKRIELKDKDFVVNGQKDVLVKDVKNSKRNATGKDLSSQMNGNITVNGDKKMENQDKSTVVKFTKLAKRTTAK